MWGVVGLQVGWLGIGWDGNGWCGVWCGVGVGWGGLKVVSLTSLRQNQSDIDYEYENFTIFTGILRLCNILFIRMWCAIENCLLCLKIAIRSGQKYIHIHELKYTCTHPNEHPLTRTHTLTHTPSRYNIDLHKLNIVIKMQ